MTEPLFTPRGIRPTAEQTAIQLARQRLVIVEANAGAAKTTTLALCLAQALRRGARPHQLLALTYTEPAVGALRDAIERIGVRAPEAKRIRVLSFDEFSRTQLKSLDPPSVRHFARAEELRQHVLDAIKAVQSNLHERHPLEHVIQGSGEGLVEGLLNSFAKLKGTLALTGDDGEPVHLTPRLADELGHDYTTLRVFKAYERLRLHGTRDSAVPRGEGAPMFRADNDATFDLAQKLLLGEPNDDEWDVDLRFVAVDEMHDTNRAMFTVLRHLLQANPEAAFVGVGDVDQVIHGVAGANADFMRTDFDRWIGTACRYPLTLSYRYGQELASAAGRVSRKTSNAAPDRHTTVTLVACADRADANVRIVDALLGRTDRAPQGPSGSIFARADVAVLLRRPDQSVGLENRLVDQGLDYVTRGFEPYLMRPEVLFVRGLLAHARDGFEAIERAQTRERVLHALLLFAGSFVADERSGTALSPDATQRQVASIAEHPQRASSFVQNQVLRNATREARPCLDAALALIRDDDSAALLERLDQTLDMRRLAKRVLVREQDIGLAAANVARLVETARSFHSVGSFFDAMNEREYRLANMLERTTRSKPIAPDAGAFVLASIDAVKGREFAHVVMPDLNRGEFPLSDATVNERNLFYVGITRAKRQLTLLYDQARPSPLLYEAGLLALPRT